MEKGNWIPCQCCGKQYVSDAWTWYVCDKCGYRICMDCYGKHSGPGNGYNHGGGKCSQCQMGWLHLVHGIRSSANAAPASKLDEYLFRARGGKISQHQELVPSQRLSQIEGDPEYRASSTPTVEYKGIIFTNTEVIAQKYRNTLAGEVRELIDKFISLYAKTCQFQWALVDLGSDDMQGVIVKDASWMDYAQLLSDFADGVGISKSARTPVFIIGGSDVVPMPEFYASVGRDVKTTEDSDWLYCFPIDYSWKKVDIKDAIFNVARLPLDYVENGYLATSVEDDLDGYFQKVLKILKDGGIPLKYAMMTANAGKSGNNDWTWTSADVMSKLPQQQLKHKDGLTKDNMFICPSLDVAGEEYDSNDDVAYYKSKLRQTDMLFINLHGSPSKSMSGYLGAEDYRPYWGMSIELIKQLNVPIINAFSCYGARYGRYYFDNNDGSMPDYEIYDREDSMLLTAFYEGNVLLFTGSCTSSMCSNVIGSGTVADHINGSNNAIDLLMPAGYAEAMLKLYACYLFQGEPAGYAMLRAKIDYLNYRAKYENKDLVFLTLNQFNLFGCPTLYGTPEDATGQLRSSINEVSIPAKRLPDVNYKTEFSRFEDGIDGVHNRARTLVDRNLKSIDEKIRKKLYGRLNLLEDDLVTIESLEYNGQLSYNLTYSKKNQLYPEFYIVQTDNDGEINEVLQSR